MAKEIDIKIHHCHSYGHDLSIEYPDGPGVVATKPAGTSDGVYIFISCTCSIKNYMNRRNVFSQLSEYEQNWIDKGHGLEVGFFLTSTREEAVLEKGRLVHDYMQEKDEMPLGMKVIPGYPCQVVTCPCKKVH